MLEWAAMERFFNVVGPCIPGKHCMLPAPGLPEGWMAVFDLDPSKPWSGKLYNRDVASGGRKIHVVGL